MTDTFNPGDKVWFCIDDDCFNGEVFDDPGGLKVNVSVGSKLVVSVFRHTLAHSKLSLEDSAQVDDN